MAYYSYYQHSQPTWGTQQYQFIPPPIPQYQPQPSWHGGDYYRAHSNSSDNTLFDYVWSKVRNLVGGTSVGRNEAHHWWKRVYGGFVVPAKLLPRELGAAAGYEAIRCWEHHRSIYVQPLSDDREREREALIGLAAAEATKLWAYTQRPRDKYGRMEASEVAASTAARIFNQSYDYDSPYEPYERRPRSRRRSISGTRYGIRAGILDDEMYDDDDDNDMLGVNPRTDYLDTYSRRSRSRRRLSNANRSSVYRHSVSPVPFTRRSVSPMGYGDVAPSSGIGLTSSAVYPDTYDPALGPGIHGTYYPNASAGGNAFYSQASSGYSPYQQLPGTSPYMNRTYAGSSVGLPPPPGGEYLSAPTTLRHHRTRSTGSYGAVRPTFGY